MKLEIGTDGPLKVRQATQLLNAVTLVDDALSMSDEWAEGLIAKLNQMFPHRLLGEELRQLGRHALDPVENLNLDLIDSVLMSIVILEHVRTCSADDDMELASLTEGSIRGQFRKNLKKTAEKLRKLLASMQFLLPDANVGVFKAELASALAGSELSTPARELSAGLGVLAGASMSHLLNDVNATTIKVTTDDDDELTPSMAV